MIARLPAWFRQEVFSPAAERMRRILAELEIDTVCGAAGCPNINRCFSAGQATFLLLGRSCTRSCAFCCASAKGAAGNAVAGDEPRRISEAAKLLGLGYAVLTSVSRDDLRDGGAAVFSAAIRCLRALGGGIKVEALIPDFQGESAALEIVVNSGPQVLGHNLETVSRLYRDLRPQADYARSLNLLAAAKKINPRLVTKSALLLGFGEKEAEVISALRDLRQAGCDIVCLGQYLAPSPRHYPVKEFIRPLRFARWAEAAREMGFGAVLSAPLARSSWLAQEVYDEFIHA